MEKNYKEDLKYRAAKKRVKDIKGFYVHLLVYLFINIAIIAVNTYRNWEQLNEIWTYSTAFFWGIGLFAHWLSVFGPNVLFGKDWEEKKIQELMEKEKRNTWE
jgi:hypothetical protein